MSHEDLPIIQCHPGPTDAELQAQRDAKHERDVEAWFAEQEILDRIRAGDPNWPEAFDYPLGEIVG